MLVEIKEIAKGMQSMCINLHNNQCLENSIHVHQEKYLWRRRRESRMGAPRVPSRRSA